MAADLAIKEPCRVASTGNISSLLGLLTIDGVTLTANDRVLVRAQTSAVNNGVYVAASGSWARAADFDGAGEVAGGTRVYVTSGTSYADSSWHVAGNGPITIGSSAIAFNRDANDILSLKDKGPLGDMAGALAAAAVELADGGQLLVPRGEWVLASNFVFTGNRLQITGESDLVSHINFNQGGVALGFDATGFEAAKTITGITKANPAVVTTSAAHGYLADDRVFIDGVGGMTNLNGLAYRVNPLTSTTFQLVEVNSSGYATYTSGGTASKVVEIGGVAQASIERLGFASNSSDTKTAVSLYNVANANVEHLTILSGTWTGGASIGVRTYGRQMVRIRDSVLACARPIVFSRNPIWPTLCTDHFLVEGCELISDAASRSVIEFEDGATISTTEIRNTALVGGRDAIRRIDTLASAASVHLRLSTLRSEQGLSLAASVSAVTKANPAQVTTSAAHGLVTGDVVSFGGVAGMTELNGNSYSILVTSSTGFTLRDTDSSGYGAAGSGGTATSFGYGLRLASTQQPLQEVLVENCRFGLDRNGVYLRKCHQTTFINCTFEQISGYCVDIELEPLSKLEFINCYAGAGAFRVTNGRLVRRSGDRRDQAFSEAWVYDESSASGRQMSNVAHGGVPQLIPNGSTKAVAICDDVFCGYISIVTDEDLGAEFFLAGGSHTVSERDDPYGFFTATPNNASTFNIYWDSGTSRYVIQNMRGLDCYVAVHLRSALAGY